MPHVAPGVWNIHDIAFQIFHFCPTFCEIVYTPHFSRCMNLIQMKGNVHNDHLLQILDNRVYSPNPERETKR